MEKIGGLSIAGTAVFILILAPIAVEGWHWGYSVIGAAVLGIAIAAWHARN